uniref:Uncharacterized protein n=1 Tax=Aotus nancymaae TaxID=37293 RepID=A0A2K5DKT9_AOTNA
MSLQSPPRLLELAEQSLLRDQVLAIPTLEELPRELFPPLFMEAFTRRCYETPKRMVQAWPFAHLPLGSLMKSPHLETLRAVLEGLGALLAQKVCPRWWKLHVLGLCNVNENFWSPCSLPRGPEEETNSRELSRPGRQQPLTVLLDLCIAEWGKQRQGLLHVHCKELQLFGMSTHSVIEVLNRVGLDSIQEVKFAPYLGQMSHLCKLVLFNIYVSACLPPDKKEQCLYVHSVCFLEDSNLKHLSWCPSICQLKELDLRGITLTHFSSEPLAVLLDQVAATLQTLDLEDRGIMNSQLSIILPALSRCSLLGIFSFCGNLISMAALENLRRHIIGLRKLSLELHPTPLESYDTQGICSTGAELGKILRDLRQPKITVFSTVPCPRCGVRASYVLESRYCLC